VYYYLFGQNMKLSTKLAIKKHKSKILGAGVLVLAIWLLVWSATPPSETASQETANANVGMLVADEPSFDFGTISMAAGKVTHIFKVKNTSADPVIVKKMYTSCMCTTASMMKDGQTYGPFGMPGHGVVPSIDQTLNSGQEVEIAVTFDPSAHGPAGVGKISRVVYLDNNAGKPFELKFSAFVTP